MEYHLMGMHCDKCNLDIASTRTSIRADGVFLLEATCPSCNRDLYSETNYLEQLQWAKANDNPPTNLLDMKSASNMIF